ncbi:ParA family protein [Streptomyces sp. Ju416(a)]|uniref:AAA family ATPase n=1 Tax=Streptomyces sp. Ju416(a) TaxID=3446591 RepID=UPI00403DF260
MASPTPGGEREKLVSKLPATLRQALKVRAAQLSTDVQDAVAAGIQAWREHPDQPALDTAGAESFGTYLPEGLYDDFKADCRAREVSYIQGLAQSVALWLTQNPAEEVRMVRRFVVCNQKGGVGKTSVAAGLAQALAEGPEHIFKAALAAGLSEEAAQVVGQTGGQRVLLVDYDPQGHLSHQLGLKAIPAGEESLVTHMLHREQAQSFLLDLTVPIDDERFTDRLRILPAAFDAFLLDSGLTIFRGPRHAALERALAPIEDHFDVIIIDAPPSLGLSMDAGLYYGRQRDDERPGASGLIIPVEAEDTSAQAYGMLINQVESLARDYDIVIDQLGLVVNKFDARRGYIATSSRDKWKELGTPPVLAVVPDLKEQREAVRLQKALLSYSPACEQSHAMRQIAKGLKQP